MSQTATAAATSIRAYQPHATGRMEELRGLPLATFTSRAAAFLIDFVVILIVYAPAMVLIQWLISRRDPNLHVDLRWDFHEPSNVVFVVLYFGLTLYLGNGRTLGKRLMGIRVVSLVHDRITFWQSIERALGYGASMLEAGFGFLQYFTNSNRCCVHDRIAETIVVRERAAKVPA
jgi:uncharacterized RDD family membrane protein YckC